MKVRDLKRGFGALVGFELVKEDGVVFTIRDIFSEVLNSVTCQSLTFSSPKDLTFYAIQQL